MIDPNLDRSRETLTLPPVNLLTSALRIEESLPDKLLLQTTGCFNGTTRNTSALERNQMPALQPGACLATEHEEHSNVKFYSEAPINNAARFMHPRWHLYIAFASS